MFQILIFFLRLLKYLLHLLNPLGRVNSYYLINHIGTEPPEGNFIQGYDAVHRVSRLTIDGLWIGERKIRTAEEGRFDLQFADVIFQ